MTFPPVVRVFFALDLPADTKETLGKYVSSIKKRSKSNAIRWAKPENLHITLQFLAEVRSEHIKKLIENVKEEMLRSLQHLSLTIGSIKLFPSPYRPRVIVLDIAPQDQLAELAAHIGRGILATHYEVEDRPFRAHLTLGRIKHPHGLDLRFLSEFTDPQIDEIEVTEVVLFRSEPHEDGSTYTVIEKLELGEGQG